MVTTYGPATEAQIARVIEACERYQETSIIALAGVPGTGKSHIASIAAQRFAGEPTRVREIQFHQSFTYEEFIEGLRIANDGSVQPVPGAFLEWNDLANEDGDLRYVLLIEELTRANVGAVLGELLTYVEHRERPFLTMFSRRSVRVASNLTLLATYNPVDRSAIDIDDALIRRLRIIDTPPDLDQLREMLAENGVPEPVIVVLRKMFEACQVAFPEDYETLMPFGHGAFSEVNAEEDLFPLWQQRLRKMLYRPLVEPHLFADTIKANYPWSESGFHLEPAASATVDEMPSHEELPTQPPAEPPSGSA